MTIRGSYCTNTIDTDHVSIIISVAVALDIPGVEIIVGPVSGSPLLAKLNGQDDASFILSNDGGAGKPFATTIRVVDGAFQVDGTGGKCGGVSLLKFVPDMAYRVCVTGCGTVESVDLALTKIAAYGGGGGVMGGAPSSYGGAPSSYGGGGGGSAGGDTAGSTGCKDEEGEPLDPHLSEALSNLFGSDTDEYEDDDAPDVGDSVNKAGDEAMTHDQILTAVGLSCSMFCLLFTVAVQVYNGNVKKTPGKIMVSLCASLFAAQFLFMFTDYPFGSDVTCKVIAILGHLFWLLSLSWSNTMVLDLVRVIGAMATTRSKRNSYWLYLAIASSVPCAVVITCIVLDAKTSIYRYGAVGNCWIQYNLAIIYSFAVPVGVSVIVNISLLIRVFVLIYRIRVSTRSLGDDAFLSHRRSAIIGLKLASVMGLTWIFGFIGGLLRNDVLLYIFTFFNSFQGVTMFFGLAYNHKRVKAWLKRKCTRVKVQEDSATETSKIGNVD